MFWFTTFRHQIELLPRLTILYGDYPNGIAFEWLWFSIGTFKGVGDDNPESIVAESEVEAMCAGIPPDNSMMISQAT